MGASYCSSFSGSVLLQTHGRPSFSVDAGEWLHYAQPVWDDAALSVLLTASGESAELVELLKPAARRQPLGLICNNTTAPAGVWPKIACRFWLAPNTATQPRPIPTLPLPRLFWHRRCWNGPGRKTPSARSTSMQPHSIASSPCRDALEEFCRGAANIEIIGRGAAYGGAVMSALCHPRDERLSRGGTHGRRLQTRAEPGCGWYARGDHLRARTCGLAGIQARRRVHSAGRKGSAGIRGGPPPAERLFPIRVDAVPEPWEGITCFAGSAGAHAGHGGKKRLPAAAAFSIWTDGTVG